NALCKAFCRFCISCKRGVHGGACSAMNFQTGMIALKHGASSQKAETKTKTHSSIHVFRTGDPGVNECEGFTCQSMLKAIGQKPRKVTFHKYRHHAALAHETVQIARLVCVGSFPTNNFDQRREMSWHKEMQPDHAFGAFQALTDSRDRKAGAVAGQQCVRSCQRFKLGKELLLDVQLFRDAFDHDVYRIP